MAAKEHCAPRITARAPNRDSLRFPAETLQTRGATTPHTGIPRYVEPPVYQRAADNVHQSENMARGEADGHLAGTEASKKQKTRKQSFRVKTQVVRGLIRPRQPRP